MPAADAVKGPVLSTLLLPKDSAGLLEREGATATGLDGNASLTVDTDGRLHHPGLWRPAPALPGQRPPVSAELPDGEFDLIVIGDLLSYLSGDALTATLDGLMQRLQQGGDLAAVHFRDRQRGGSYDGFTAHAALTAAPGQQYVVHHEDECFLLDVLRRPS